MILLASLLHYISISLIVVVSSVAVSIGESLATLAALQAISRQPGIRGDIIRGHMLGAAIIEGAAIFSILIASLLIQWAPPNTISLAKALAEVGMCLAMVLTSGVIAIVSSFPVIAACNSIARQPFMSQKIVSLMVISLALLQTPLLSALMVSFCIQFQISALAHVNEGIRLLAAGIVIGLGSIGPALGLALSSQNALIAVAMSKKMYNKIFSFTLFSQAIIETGVIFSLIISLLMLFAMLPLEQHHGVKAVALLGAAICSGLGSLGVGIGSGNIAKTALCQIGSHPESYESVSKLSFSAQGIAEASVVYASLISFFLIFFV